MTLYTQKKMVTVGHTTNEMVGKQIFFWSREKKRNSTLHASLYKMNFPRKNPMKMAAITTRREGRGLATLSLKDAAEVDPGLSECATFLSLKPSSLRCRFSSDSFIISPWSLLHSSMSFLVSVSLSETLCGFGMGPSCLEACRVLFFFFFFQESVNSFIFFMLNTMGQDCKDEKLSQQLPHKG